MSSNDKFELRGVNHIALVCSDMDRTVRFYRDVLGMPLVKTIELPGGIGQHFFFDIGNDDCLAFFWFANAGPAQPGVSHAPTLPDRGDIASAHASMNHLAFDVPLDEFEEYHRRLAADGIEVSMIFDHDDSELQIAPQFHPGVFVRSFYFRDPDGILLEFASWTRELGRPQDVDVAPVDAFGVHVAPTGPVAAMRYDRRPTDRTPVHTDGLPATPVRDRNIPAGAWVEAPESLTTLGDDLPERPEAEYKRRIGDFLVWRAGPARGGDARYWAARADQLDEAFTFRLFPDGSGHGVGADGAVVDRFRAWKETLRDA